jgi:hypothetical protein
MRAMTHSNKVHSTIRSVGPDALFADSDRKVIANVLDSGVSNDIEPPIDSSLLSAWFDAAHRSLSADGTEFPTGIKLLNPMNRTSGRRVHSDYQTFNFNDDRTLLLLVQDRFKTDYPDGHSYLQTYRKYRRLAMLGSCFGSDAWNKGRDSHILARFMMARHVQTEADSPAVSSLFAGRVEYFFSVEVTSKTPPPRPTELKVQGSGAAVVSDLARVHYFAKCRWYSESSRHAHLSKSVWSTDLVAATESDNVIPVQRIAASFLMGRLKSDNNLFQVLVLPNQLCAWDPYDIEDSLDAEHVELNDS